MRYGFKHLLIGFRRNNFHRKLLFHLRVIRQGIDIEVRSLGDSVCHNINGLIYDFIVGSAVFHRIVELINRNVHSDVAAFRCNCDCLITLIQLVYSMNGKINLGSLLVKSVLHILYEFFFETFVIHILISFLFALALDRHPLPG